MRERGSSTLATVLIAGVAGILVAALAMNWVVVDVRTTDGDGPEHIVIPFPLAAARLATAFVPRDAYADATVPPELRAHKAEVMAVLEALAAAPDATFVKVDAPDARVRVAKEGSTITVDVIADDATVHCAIPVDGVREALERWDWETFSPKIAFDVLGAARRGDLVRVDAPDAKVSIRMW